MVCVHAMEVNAGQCLVAKFFKKIFLCKRKKLIQAWNDMRLTKLIFIFELSLQNLTIVMFNHSVYY